MTETPPGALPPPVVPGLTDLSVFARGGYATVYRAVQLSVGREVAVKVENRTLDSESDQQRFLREARAAGRMSSHPHVVDLFDVGVTEDQHPYLIMELCDGSYAERMRRSPLGAVEARNVGVKIADALAHSHAAGVLHRDVKPANILHSHFNPAVLADFGLAVLAEVREPSVTLEVLTPAYAPPEMFRQSPPAPSVDVYALCATLYAVMHGKPPRWPVERDPSLLMLMELFHQPIPELPGVPTELVDVLRRGMANDPAARPSAEELRDMLAAVPLGPGAAAPISAPPISAPPISAPPISGVPEAGAFATTAVPPTAEVTQRVARPVRRSRWQATLAVAGALALLVTVGVLSWLAGRYSPAEPGPSPSAVAGLSASPTPSGFGVLPGCRTGLPGGARCPDELECYGPVRIRGTQASADRVPCAGRHTFEAYALGDVPADGPLPDYPTVRAQPACGPSTFAATTGIAEAGGWHLEVLPPQPPQVAAGDRSYRCLAGKGAGALAGPTLTH